MLGHILDVVYSGALGQLSLGDGLRVACLKSSELRPRHALFQRILFCGVDDCIQLAKAGSTSPSHQPLQVVDIFASQAHGRGSEVPKEKERKRERESSIVLFVF